MFGSQPTKYLNTSYSHLQASAQQVTKFTALAGRGEDSSENKEFKNLYEIPSDQQPEDSVSSIVFMDGVATGNTHTHLFAVSSWDGSIRIFNIEEQISSSIMSTVEASTPKVAPMFKVCFQAPVLELYPVLRSNTLVATLGDGLAVYLDCMVQKHHELTTCPGLMWAGMTPQPKASTFEFSQIVVMVSIHKKSYFYKPENLTLLQTIELSFKPLCADMNEEGLLLGMTDCKMAYLSLKSFSQSSKYTYIDFALSVIPHTLHLSKSTKDFIFSTVDGRLFCGSIASSYSGEPKMNRKIAYKGHKLEDSSQNELYPVNSVGFIDPSLYQDDLLFSAGQEGTFKIWDLRDKETVLELEYGSHGLSLVQAAVSPRGKYAVMSFGYDWALGVWGLGDRGKDKRGLFVKRVEFKRKKEGL